MTKQELEQRVLELEAKLAQKNQRPRNRGRFFPNVRKQRLTQNDFWGLFTDEEGTRRFIRGRHVYIRANWEGTKKLAGGELRGCGGICMLPPSIHPDGTHYKWLIPPKNESLRVIEPEQAGFLSHVTEHTEYPEHTEKTEQNEQTEAIEVYVVFWEIIRETLPKEYGTRNRQIFEFARKLKSLPQLANTKAKECRKLVNEWYLQAQPYIRTKAIEETWIDFLKAWDRILLPKGDESMSQIFEKASEVDPPDIAVKKYPNNFLLQQLVAWCRELQKTMNNRPFYLAARTAARYLEIDHMTANRYLFLLVNDGILDIVTKGRTAQNPRKATRYRYIAD